MDADRFQGLQNSESQTTSSSISKFIGRPILRPREAAEYLGISERMLRTLMSDGEIRYSKPKRAVLIRVCDIEAFLDRHSVKGGLSNEHGDS